MRGLNCATTRHLATTYHEEQLSLSASITTRPLTTLNAVVVGVADFLNNSFISFYDVHVFQEVSSSSLMPCPLLCHAICHQWCSLLTLDSLCEEGKLVCEGKEKSIQQQFHDSLAISSK